MKESVLKISKKEYKFVGLIILIAMAVTTGPYLYSYLNTPEGKVYTGLHFLSPGDVYLYYSYFQQIGEGEILLRNLYTPESHQATLFNPFFIAAGLAGKLFNLNNTLILQLSRILLIPFLITALYFFISYFFKDIKKRRFALVVGTFGSGLGYIAAGFLKNSYYNTRGYYHWPMDLWVTESNIYLSLIQNPLYILSFGLIIVALLLFIISWQKNSLRAAFLGGLAAMLLFIVHPYHPPTIYGVIGAFLFVEFFRDRRKTLSRWKVPAVYGLVSFLPIPYLIWLVASDPMVKLRMMNQGGYTTVWWLTLFSFGFLLIFSLLEIAAAAKSRRIETKKIFLIVWLAVGLILIYMDFLQHPRRLTEGLQVPMIILFTFFSYRAMDYFSRKGGSWKSLIAENKFLIFFLLVIFVFFSNIANSLRGYGLALEEHPRLYVQRQDMEAMEWFKSAPKGSVVLAHKLYGNMIPGVSGRAVFLGHSSETANIEGKLLEITIFFGRNRPEEQEMEFLKKYGITHIAYGPWEASVGSYDPEAKSYLKKVFNNDRNSLYRVVYD